MSIRRLLALSFVTFAACGGGDGDDNPGNPDAPTDARPPVDARPSRVMEVNCTGATVTATFTTQGSSFNVVPAPNPPDPPPPAPVSATITRNQIVKFVSTSGHPIDEIPGNPDSDPGLEVASGEKCFAFPTMGIYAFRCSTHGFAGKVTVNQ